jgi:YidC/Oxa1 family membrane protein insertase
MNSIANFFENLFSPVVNVLGEVLRYFHFGLDLPWWLAIALLTVVVRSILFPLTIKQVKSMRAMQDLRPEMERIRAQFRDNRQRQQEEIMKLYQERKVNPLGGCLPILIQMPIFIGIFYVIRQFGGYKLGDEVIPPQYESFHEGGLFWFQNLSAADPTLILPILSALTMLAATEITAKNIDPQQRWIMRILPLGITVFLYTFPAGLFVYWITSNLVTLVQNFVIYNYGPGKKTPEAAPDKNGSKSADRAAPQSSKNGSSNDEQNDSDGAVTSIGQSARAAKRRRRKKKK